MHMFSEIEVASGFPALTATISCYFRTHSPQPSCFLDQVTAFFARSQKVSE